MKQTTARRIACNELITPEGQCLTLYSVEISEGFVTGQFPLLQETANTEWMRGRVVLRKDDDGRVRAYYQEKLIK